MNHRPQLACEAFGTFFLVLGISLILQQTPREASAVLRPVGISALLLSLIYAFGHICKAQFNPAVTFAMWMLGVFETTLSMQFVAVQLLFGMIGALFASSVLLGPTSTAPENLPAPPIYHSGAQHAKVGLAECVFTFLLVSVILQVALSRQRGNQHYGLAIASCVCGSIFAIGPVSGCALNPAVSTSLILVKLLITESTPDTAPALNGLLTQMFLHVSAQLIGSLAAVMLHRYVQPFPAEIEKEIEEEKAAELSALKQVLLDATKKSRASTRSGSRREQGEHKEEGSDCCLDDVCDVGGDDNSLQLPIRDHGGNNDTLNGEPEDHHGEYDDDDEQFPPTEMDTLLVTSSSGAVYCSTQYKRCGAVQGGGGVGQGPQQCQGVRRRVAGCDD